MKKLMILGMGVCVALAFTSCKSSESAYKKAYEKAKQQELASDQTTAPVETTPVVTAPVVTAPVVVERTPVAPEAGVRQEKVTSISGDELKDYSVVCGSFGLKANAEGLRDYLVAQGYKPIIAFNAEAATYRVIVATYPDRTQAAAARDLFKERYPNNKDFQGAWLLYRLY
ncbi:SPOR domain-containing protein [Bacteroides sp. 51]|uniref:SPOR domain-containing protein n=1 Tax=Bacteroides sp. 51 TaxID=2302938 RepID=UPI0013D02CDA|nr:SPOR domain-containing protein [Bacteroides sp. 51]NDV81419.1 SPOR domain-containing protein [Bacteroides sp. 51]